MDRHIYVITASYPTAGWCLRTSCSTLCLVIKQENLEIKEQRESEYRITQLSLVENRTAPAGADPDPS